jgi:DNA polymerase elongation subunit (family B)
MDLLALDIETAPITAHAWGLFKQNIGINQIIDTGRVMCFSAKWIGTPQRPVFRSEFHHGHKETIKACHALLDKADAVLTYNGERFDLPTLNKEFVKYRMKPPAPAHSIDLLRVAKRRFRFASNKMDHLAHELRLTRKVTNRGHDLWIDCMNGKRKAWAEMREYNLGDIQTLEELYYALLPWIDTHPNTALFADGCDRPTCPSCGSTHLQARGTQRTKTQAYQRYQCRGCGTWLRGRYSVVKGNKNVMTLIGGKS